MPDVGGDAAGKSELCQKSLDHAFCRIRNHMTAHQLARLTSHADACIDGRGHTANFEQSAFQAFRGGFVRSRSFKCSW
jgi:hypothetical protein